MYTYFLTIDKVKLNGKPPKNELLSMRNELCVASELSPCKPYQIYCFEWKEKGKQHGKYLHYHCILQSSRSFIPYKEMRREGWSNVLKRLYKPIDILRTAGYINKLKVDGCDVVKHLGILYIN